MYVKICGLCRPKDAEAAAAAGADYLGVVLAPGGPRTRTVRQAAEIFAAGPGAGRVGVFVDPEPAAVRSAAEALRLDVVQLHGSEPPDAAEALCAAGEWAVWKALRPRDREEFLEGVAAYSDLVDALLLDGWSAHRAGGTGTRFPWDEVAAVRDALPERTGLIVAGGLTPESVGTAIRRLAPDGVDVSSGVERRVGEKAPALIRAFVDRARDAAGADTDGGADGAAGTGGAVERDGDHTRRVET